MSICNDIPLTEQDPAAFEPFTRERSAKLIEAMAQWKPWNDKRNVRVALSIAARAVRRGRHLTEAEQIENLAKSMEEDGDPEGIECAAVLRSKIHP